MRGAFYSYSKDELVAVITSYIMTGLDVKVFLQAQGVGGQRHDCSEELEKAIDYIERSEFMPTVTVCLTTKGTNGRNLQPVIEFVIEGHN